MVAAPPIRTSKRLSLPEPSKICNFTSTSGRMPSEAVPVACCGNPEAEDGVAEDLCRRSMPSEAAACGADTDGDEGCAIISAWRRPAKPAAARSVAACGDDADAGEEGDAGANVGDGRKLTASQVAPHVACNTGAAEDCGIEDGEEMPLVAGPDIAAAGGR